MFTLDPAQKVCIILLDVTELDVRFYASIEAGRRRVCSYMCMKYTPRDPVVSAVYRCLHHNNLLDPSPPQYL